MLTTDGVTSATALVALPLSAGAAVVVASESLPKPGTAQPPVPPSLGGTPHPIPQSASTAVAVGWTETGSTRLMPATPVTPTNPTAAATPRAAGVIVHLMLMSASLICLPHHRRSGSAPGHVGVTTVSGSAGISVGERGPRLGERCESGSAQVQTRQLTGRNPPQPCTISPYVAQLRS